MSNITDDIMKAANAVAEQMPNLIDGCDCLGCMESAAFVIAEALWRERGHDLYVIWSNEHRMWWRPQSAGYTRKLSEAGHYFRDEAIAIAKGARDGWKGGYPDEIAIRLNDAEAMSGES